MRTFTGRYAIATHTIRTCITATGIDGAMPVTAQGTRKLPGASG
jgi:hypothetical protein